jgi:CRISPR/Cas system Type II protein with McrA/HNH and RuvC-like nuclease domain
MHFAGDVEGNRKGEIIAVARRLRDGARARSRRRGEVVVEMGE